MGKIDGMLSNEENAQTPLQKKLKTGADGQASGLRSAGGLRGHLRGRPFQRHPGAGDLYDQRITGRFRHPRGASRHCGDRPVHRHATHGEEKRAETGRRADDGLMVLSLSQIVQAYNIRSEHSLFRISIFSNARLNDACLISLLLVALVLFTFVGTAFELVRLPWTLYLIALGLSLAPVVVMELSKAFTLIKHL